MPTRGDARLIAGQQWPSSLLRAEQTCRGYLRQSRRVRGSTLILLTGAATVALVPTELTVAGRPLVLGPALAGVLLICSNLAGLVLAQDRPSEEAAEAARLAARLEAEAWRFATATGPYAAAMADAHSLRTYARRIQHLLCGIPAGEVDTETVEVTPWMSATRRRSLPERVDVYVEQRVKERQAAHRGEAVRALAARNRARWTLRVSQVVTVGVAVGQATGLLGVDLVGPAAAASAAMIAWLETERYDASAAFSAAVVAQLGVVEPQFDCVTGEPQFAQLVNEVERIVSRDREGT